MAISIVWSDVSDFAPELASLPTAQQDSILASLPLQMSEDVWGTQLDLGAVYLAAHLGTVAKRKGAGGAVQSQSVGQVSRSFAAGAGASPFASTAYGMLYENLMMTLAGARFDVA